MKDDQIAKIVSELTRIAIEFKDTQQLRQNISNYLVPILKEKKNDESNKEN